MSEKAGQRIGTSHTRQPTDWSVVLGEGGCTHLDLIQDITSSTDGCEECLALGDTWVNLRLCLICGHVGCCDDSKNRHAARHYSATQHPLMRSLEPGLDWVWCYVDEVLLSSV